MGEFWTMVGSNWHKVIVVILVLAHAWKFFFEYIRPAIKSDKESQPMTIVLPKEGCTIIIKPLDDSKKD
jgi:hypothetical protein